jgi:hypothetical protein
MISIYLEKRNEKKKRTHIFRNRKRAIFLRVPEEVDQQLREYISTTYLRFEKGLLSHVIIQAIIKLIDEDTHTHESDSPRKSNDYYNVKNRKVIEEIKNYLIERYGYQQPKEIPEKHLIEAISEIRGGDRRTIRNWIEVLVRGGYIRRTEPYAKQFEVLT